MFYWHWITILESPDLSQLVWVRQRPSSVVVGEGTRPPPPHFLTIRDFEVLFSFSNFIYITFFIAVINSLPQYLINDATCLLLTASHNGMCWNQKWGGGVFALPFRKTYINQRLSHLLYFLMALVSLTHHFGIFFTNEKL